MFCSTALQVVPVGVCMRVYTCVILVAFTAVNFVLLGLFLRSGARQPRASKLMCDSLGSFGLFFIHLQ